MISVVIPTLDAEAHLTRTLAALVPAAMDGVVRELIVSDGGSTDGTRAIADEAGAVIIEAVRGRGSQLGAGAGAARCSWLMFLHADTVLAPGWDSEASDFMRDVDRGARPDRAAAFRFALDDHGMAARIVERGVALRNRLFRLPFGDQGLLISRRLYDAVGGYRPLPIMEDVDFARRLGRSRIAMLGSRAITSADRYRRDGYVRRVLRNQSCLLSYACGGDPARLAARYLGRPPTR
ncbi:MAG: TIGR04283 family arsenosugar biosynthesis glycosyltransferase [Hyphomicrobium sp.]